ncbi:MAG: gluconate 2-dehydrogenase subunit 3 family protein [Gemmatimonadaceae bacterium]|nr:gluconate 2-dehydrogenase subunit 3 family protein [Gemmatimonadaceae bacterium]
MSDTTPTPGTSPLPDESLDGRGRSRRRALQVLAVAAVTPALPSPGFGAPATPDPAVVEPDESQATAAGPRGTPSDPDLLRPRITWSNKLTAPEMVTLTALCDMIIPADSRSPSASAVGVPGYINHWVSAPYDGNQRELVRLRGGLAWLNTESRRRFGRTFARASTTQRAAICDDICFLPNARPEHRAAARFFDRVRDLTAEGFYTTDEGMKDIGYVGNVALPRFDGPPPAVLKHLGLA